MAKVIWTGLEELKAELRALPSELAGEASNDVLAAANGAAVTLRTIYGEHEVTGHLQQSVDVAVRDIGPFGASVVVTVSDPIAWLFDHGSQARHYITASGATHETGRMWGKTPPTHAAARTFATARRAMYDRLKSMLVRHGLTVSGEP